MLVTDTSLIAADALPGVVRRLCAAGVVDAVQLREKAMTEAEVVALGRALRDATMRQPAGARGEARALLLVNSSVAAARACDADGVHVPEDAPLPRDRAGLLVGRSVHSVEGARRAEAEGVDYIVLGTIFPSRSHPGGATGGVPSLIEVREAVRLPIIAIGGITSENAAAAIAAGADGVAVISAILATPDPLTAALSLRAAIMRAHTNRLDEGA